MKLLDGLYAYVWEGNDNNCNSYLITGALKGSRHLLVDPGYITTPFYREPGLDRLFQDMKGDGLDAGQIGLVILTHSHPDHCEAARVIRGQNGALVALHKADEPVYRKLGGKIDIYLQEGELVLGEASKLSLKVFHSPGHSPGHITVYWPDEKVLIAGDAIFYRSTGRVDLPGGSVRALKQSIERLSQLDIEYLLCGHPYGHPGIMRGKSAVEENFEFVKRNILF
jgi:glyoxylase-like metal-dependent hydrolase (beta-lactamase superfamily II)